MSIGLELPEGPLAVAFLLDTDPSLQLEQYHVPSGIDWNFKQAAHEKKK